MKRLLALFLFVSQAYAAQPPIHWGVEDWQCGFSWFLNVIGDGRDIVVYQIDVGVTATPPNFTGNTQPNLQRQALVSMSYIPVKGWMTDGWQAVVSSNTMLGYFNNEVDPGIWAINPKTIGLNPWSMSKQLNFGQSPVLVKYGRLELDVANGDAGAQRPGDCLDVEMHLTIIWDYAQTTPQ